ncbi:metallophosphoesterase [Caloramator sp. Dgby_cultured_2]|uniref:metallophosphoesterase n=1 Tax=Caloramator sp. Dgby_cultured_2 TaxID=3029174 RepID=UPI00237E7501|nr:metallophosphoesterase [Caloramator sp. Dgby_cultured_2]WDU82131.1 metallophosphoesterase [Caloramator sp. Dgby_cultured_2]
MALEILKDCEVILCAGDILYHGPRNPILEGYNPIELADKINNSEIPVIIAKGNCDAEVDGMVLNVPVFLLLYFTRRMV